MRRLAIAFGALAFGLATWLVVASLGNLVLRFAFAGYRDVEPTMGFTPAMLAARLLLGARASAACGVATRIGAGARAPLALASGIVLLAFFLPAHVALWDRFPTWYHAAFLASLPLIPAAAARYAPGLRRWRTSR
ncbi:MAG TPA: hypothetical protein VMU33_06760 [Burkholderiaceae bacterium]|nr:hypothetical protein [Burkholderiaceae bacterium]